MSSLQPSEIIRGSQHHLRQDVTKLCPKDLDLLVRGVQRIQALPSSHPDPFAQIASYHGIPAWYCQHGNVLSPLWHRAYILRLERALRNVLEDESFEMPFWDEMSKESAKKGPPSILTRKTDEWSDGSGPRSIWMSNRTFICWVILMRR
ncbi:uncharacterized protein QC761_109995 [Podospora bellae-mahoneyi]|uniref:tyrosinase n=1 Tax=Podospora bellae-mahoneyi TaxID=2093777 RepID=A0ABR0FYR9_9PEZI|nr:hypothetical protein QC761_109995 [Podospora bellae-mahoneyi]